MTQISDKIPTIHVSEEFVYRNVDGIAIGADVYLPPSNFRHIRCPVFLYIHGGGWISGTRKDINAALVHELLQKGIIVTSIDYRLMPEVTFEEQLEDIRSAEKWARIDISSKIKTYGFQVMPDKVIVGGSSAGGHLAMMVPHVWQIPPVSLLVMYGPTDLTSLTPIDETVEALQTLPPIIPEIVKAALFDAPRTFTSAAPETYLTSPRALLGLEFFRSGGIGEFITAGLAPGFVLRKAGSLPPEKIAKISPALLPLQNYPPLFHAIGTKDQIFSTDQATNFANKLQGLGVLCETLIVTGAEHGFDMKATLGGDTHRNVLLPAVKFVCQFLRDQANGGRSRGIVTINTPTDCFTVPAEYKDELNKRCGCQEVK